MSLLPVFLKLDRRPCLIIGAGSVALQKIPALLNAEAEVRVIAPRVHPEIAALAAAGRITLQERGYRPDDLDGLFLVIAATNDSAVNTAIYEEALRRNLLCNAVDDPPNCDFYFGSIVTRGDLQIAISTAGESPAFAQKLRKEIDAQLPEDLGPWLHTIGEQRGEILEAYEPGEDRKLLLHQLAQRPTCEAAACPAQKLALRARHAGASR
ncbi:precorrin-2 dehydrogenase/sirohydrochlorin ferrochelatase family protein [Silvibacterium dinghuense]|uniref:precorrin-2 dehydrogenase n=1 Tax=Silvibacterium dinghuense TaxID=1560006 RepID=A0A4Q1SIF4_9BACT|nr:bifunctional precorrin-2 dehydrogenase/sirohydrochlorin ferrochelatase [Silvibacterium dinghuense]RXS97177.1 bifunctional precorrin-2 dehydrogenase/sirohydrochlorin ferrochelatase [Silvibacterium dinghuense]GGG96860.1 hypothetical protein GCM10011586_10100 [Silvibacterium dinghuense]